MDRSEVWAISPDGMAAVDARGTVTDVSPGFSALLGWDAAAVVGRPLDELLTDRSPAGSSWTASAWSGEGRWRTADGGNRVLATTMVPSSSGVLCVVRADAAAPEHLRQVVRSEALLAEAERIARIGSWEWLVTSDVAVGSRQLREMLGFDDVPASYDELIRRVHPDDRQAVEQAFLRTLTTGEPFESEMRVIRPDGIELVVHQVGQCEMRDGVPYRMRGTIQDVTDRHRLEAELRQAQRLESVGRLAGGIAHDFNNYLQIVVGYVDVAIQELERAGEQPDVVRTLRQARRGADRAADLTRQMLLFARPPLGHPEPVDVSAFVASHADLWRRMLGPRSTLHVVTAAVPAVVRCDPAQLDQVLMNLVLNSRDAMPDGGRVDLRVDVPGAADGGRWVVLVVRDTGIGMDAATLAQVMEPFFTTKGPEHGIGMGLSSTYGIVNRLGGSVRIVSEEGVGTAVELRLPLAEAEVAVAGGRAAEGAEGR